MKKVLYTGSGVALVTPMHADGSINYEKYGELIEFQIENGTDALIACATTGESPVLSHEEHCKALEYAIQKVNKRIPVIASTGSNDTAYAVKLSQEAEKLGADGLLLVTPYYNKTSQVGLVRHYEYIADRVNTPMMLYNVPSRTGCNIKPETYLELSKHPNINSVKEANGDISSVAQSVSLCGDQLHFYSGNDDQTLPMMVLGGKGVVSVFANILPKEMHEICAKFFAGDMEGSRNLTLKYVELMNAFFMDVNPIPIKAAMNRAGFDVGNCRLPLTTMDDGALKKLIAIMEKYQLI